MERLEEGKVTKNQEKRWEDEPRRFEITFHVRIKGRMHSGNIVRALSKIPGIISIRWH